MKSWPSTHCLRVCIRSVPQLRCRTDAPCPYSFPFPGYLGTFYISGNVPVAKQFFTSFLSHFPPQNETLWEIWPSAKNKKKWSAYGHWTTAPINHHCNIYQQFFSLGWNIWDILSFESSRFLMWQRKLCSHYCQLSSYSPYCSFIPTHLIISRCQLWYFTNATDDFSGTWLLEPQEFLSILALLYEKWNFWIACYWTKVWLIVS